MALLMVFPGVITLLVGVITPFITGRGPPCALSLVGVATVLSTKVESV